MPLLSWIVNIAPGPSRIGSASNAGPTVSRGNPEKSRPKPRPKSVQMAREQASTENSVLERALNQMREMQQEFISKSVELGVSLNKDMQENYRRAFDAIRQSNEAFTKHISGFSARLGTVEGVLVEQSKAISDINFRLEHGFAVYAGDLKDLEDTEEKNFRALIADLAVLDEHQSRRFLALQSLMGNFHSGAVAIMDRHGQRIALLEADFGIAYNCADDDTPITLPEWLKTTNLTPLVGHALASTEGMVRLLKGQPLQARDGKPMRRSDPLANHRAREMAERKKRAEVAAIASQVKAKQSDHLGRTGSPDHVREVRTLIENMEETERREDNNGEGPSGYRRHGTEETSDEEDHAEPETKPPPEPVDGGYVESDHGEVEFVGGIIESPRKADDPDDRVEFVEELESEGEKADKGKGKQRPISSEDEGVEGSSGMSKVDKGKGRARSPGADDTFGISIATQGSLLDVETELYDHYPSDDLMNFDPDVPIPPSPLPADDAIPDSNIVKSSHIPEMKITPPTPATSQEQIAAERARIDATQAPLDHPAEVIPKAIPEVAEKESAGVDIPTSADTTDMDVDEPPKSVANTTAQDTPQPDVVTPQADSATRLAPRARVPFHKRSPSPGIRKSPRHRTDQTPEP